MSGEAGADAVTGRRDGRRALVTITVVLVAVLVVVGMGVVAARWATRKPSEQAFSVPLGNTSARTTVPRSVAAPTTAPPTSVRTPGKIVIPLHGDARLPSLQFYGDSITAKSADALLAEFSPHFRVGIEAVGGSPTGWFVLPIAADELDPPDVVVINLGTNDAACREGICDGSDGLIARPDFDAQVVEANLDSFRSGYPTSTCVVFVNISTHNPTWGPANAATINAHLATFPRVVDWDRAWQPGWFDTPDTPHPNATGQRALSELIATQVATCPSTVN